MVARKAEELLGDMRELGSRDYSQVGVPMFLVAEDLRAAQPRIVDTSAEWREVAAQFTQAAVLLSAHRPDLGPADVARLVELLADRNLLGSTASAFSALAGQSGREIEEGE